MKIIVLTFLLLSLSSNILAQDVSFGIKGGVNFSNSSEKDVNSQSVTSFHIGGVMEALFSDKIAIQPEILYSGQGFVDNSNNVERSIKLTYINVPVMVKYFLRPGFAIEAGPQIGYLNSAKLETIVNGETVKSDIKEGLRANDLSLNLGVGFKLNNGLNFNVRYCYGLTNITNRLSEEKFKNRVLQLSVGYFF